MRILVTGASGLVGSALSSLLVSRGHKTVGLTRKSGESPSWDPDRGHIDAESLEGFDAVIHLAGENIASGRWTPKKKERIRSSRVQGTELLCRTLAGLQSPPKTLIAASAIGFYGDRGEEKLDESSDGGSDFLAEVCQDWERSTSIAEAAGIRVARVRIGVILTPQGGALAKMLFPFKMGGGGKLGNGRQWMSWISLDDTISAIEHCLTQDELKGAINLVAPNPVTNTEFTKTLGRVLKRPTLVPMPGFAARAAFGEMAEALLLSSTRVLPRRLERSGFRFLHPTLEVALRSLLDRNEPRRAG